MLVCSTEKTTTSKSASEVLSKFIQRKSEVNDGNSLSCLIATNDIVSRIQTKLAVGKSGDKYEREADKTADQVVTNPTSSVQTSLQFQKEKEEEEIQEKSLLQRQEEEEEETAQAKPLVQRQAEEEEENVSAKPLIQKQEDQEEEEAVQEKPLLQRQMEEEEETAQTKPLVQHQAEEEEETVSAKPLIQKQEEGEEEEVQAKGGSTQVSASVQENLDSSKGSGNPLPESTLTFMETSFGRDFSNVRVHADSNAVQMSKELGAQAFTHRNNIYFNTGRYDPNSTQGQRLLAHELTHTIQQGSASPLSYVSSAKTSVMREEENTAEQIDMEAELAASEEEAQIAIDPVPAEKAKEDAQRVKPEVAKEAQERKAGGKEIEKKEKEEEGKPKKRVKSFFLRTGKEEEEPVGEVGEYLKATSAHVVGRAIVKSQILATNEKTHDPADEKLAQTESAVKPPIMEGQSKSNAEQVGGLDQATPPQPDEIKAKKTLNDEVEKAVPGSLKELNEFKSKGKTVVIGNKVLGRVKEDTDDVQKTYVAIEEAPPPKIPEKEPVELPPQEVALETEELNLGAGAVPNIKDEHTDLTKFDKESDELIQEEGITDEQLNMVDEGDLAEANKERKGIKKNVAEQPTLIKESAVQEKLKVHGELRQEEMKTKAEMRDKRISALAETKEKQRKTKTSFELKREAVTKHINTIYENAQKSVTLKLNNLEKQSLKTFDQRQARFSRGFEREVKRDVNAWKRKRYSGFWGPAKWLKDKFCGIDDFPEVKRAFDRARTNYIKKIDKLIVDITKVSTTVIKECKQDLAMARLQIKKYVDGLGPDLKNAGKQAMADMSSKLKDLDGFIDKRKKQLAQKLADKREEAIKKIDQKIEKMKEEMSGALAKLGNLLLQAALKFFKWALKKAGYNTKQLMGIINKGKAVITKIVKDPIGFIKNIVLAVKTGIFNFQKNIKKHLIGGLINWLTGAMGDIDIQLPSKFNLRGIIFFVLQILGLTWSNIRKKLVKRLGEKVVSAAEKTIEIVKKIVTEGPMALWEMIKTKAAEIKQTVIEGIRNWAIVELVKQGIIKLISFLNPVGAIIQAILAIYNTIMFFVENWQRIVTFVKTVFNSISDIAMGKISAAAAAVERALAMTIPIILNFLARMLNLSGIGKAVKNIIKKIRKPIDKVVDKAIDFIVKKARKLFMKGKTAVEKGIKKIIEWWKVKKKFKAKDGKVHTLYFKGKGRNAKLMITSNSTQYKDYIKKLEVTTQEQKTAKNHAIKIADEIDGLTKKTKTDMSGTKDHSKEFNILLSQLAKATKIFVIRQDDKLPASSAPVYGGVSPGGGFANSMRIDKLTKIGPAGTTPSVSNKNWIHLNKRKSRGGCYYIRGHLLNQNLHGLGSTWLNITPLSRSGNARHETEVESFVKEAVKKERTVEYSVSVNYAWSFKSTLFEKLNKSENPKDKIRAEVVKAEQYVPLSLTCQAEEIDPKTGESIPSEKKVMLNINKTVPNKIEESETDYQVIGEEAKKKDPVNLSKEDDKNKIAAVVGLNIDIAERIIELKKERGGVEFHSWSQLGGLVGISEDALKKLAAEGKIKLK